MNYFILQSGGLLHTENDNNIYISLLEFKNIYSIFGAVEIFKIIYLIKDFYFFNEKILFSGNYNDIIFENLHGLNSTSDNGKVNLL